MIVTAAGVAQGGEVQKEKDADSGYEVLVAKQGNTTVRLVPAAGCNAYSINYAGTELLKTPKTLKELPGFMYGNPVLYPTPNRVREAKFTFQGTEYKFTANNDSNFLHGLVHSVPWEVVDTSSGEDHATIRCRYKFEPGSETFKLFPHSARDRADHEGHRQRRSVQLHGRQFARRQARAVRHGLPPVVLISRLAKETYLTVPATHLMEAENLLPTGKLLELTGTKYDARTPISLEDFVIDDVYFGMQSSQPAVIDFREKKLKITLHASEDFTHMVVYTPKDEPWFCVENQTCSTDAHNLFAKGLEKQAHLIILEPGKTFSGHAAFEFSKY